MSQGAGKSLLQRTIAHLLSDRLATASLGLVALYLVIAVLVWSGVWDLDLAIETSRAYRTPGSKFWFGTDLLGVDVFNKTIYGICVAFSVGLVASAIAIPIGALLGALAGYFGGWVDDAIVWLYSTVTSVPQILLLLSLSFALGKGLTTLYIAIGLTSWVGICRLIRGEVLKHKRKEYVQAARSMGASHWRRVFVHILPNVFHLLIIDFSLRFIYAIKSEAILSYLGLGVQGKPSWGVMISDAKDELLNGVWWQLAAATLAMFLLVLAFNILGDSLRDFLDPRLQRDE